MIAVETLLFCGASIIVYFALCGASLMNFAHKYKIPEDEIILFIDNLKFPITIIKDIVLYDKSYQYIFSNEVSKEFLTNKILWGMVSLAIPLLFIINIFVSSVWLEKARSLLCCIFFIILFYKSWRFGHTLKSKAQPDQSPTD